jgi:hypothetical protein
MKSSPHKRILLILPEPLLRAADEVAETLSISRLAVIRLCLIRSLGSLDQNGLPHGRDAAIS